MEEKIIMKAYKIKLISDEQLVILNGGNPNNFDITLLVIHFFTVLPEPFCGWMSQHEPDDQEICISDDLVRVHFIRNHLYTHIAECSISDEDFQKQWSKLVEILVRFGAEVHDIHSIESMEMTAEQR